MRLVTLMVLRVDVPRSIANVWTGGEIWKPTVSAARARRVNPKTAPMSPIISEARIIGVREAVFVIIVLVLYGLVDGGASVDNGRGVGTWLGC